MGGTRVLSALFVTLTVLSAGAARADDGSSVAPATAPAAPSEPADQPKSSIGPSYLYDGGAVPFIYGALAARIFLDTYTTPADSPKFFSTSEGGAPKASWEVPGWSISALGGVSAIGMLASGDSSRAYHVKGLAESLSTGVMVTAAIKVVVARHRPDWTEGTNTNGSRRSFPSGHSTQAFAIATYSVLFLRDHVFNKYRGDRTLPWYEAATYSGIMLGAAALAGERVYHNRHHLSDVAIGGLLGTASSTAFYLYQEHRYNNHRAEDRHQKALSINPTQGSRGATVGLSFLW